MKEKEFLLDASALLAALFQEPGGEITLAALGHSAMSAVNYSEVIAKQVKRGEAVSAAVRNIEDLELPILAWDAELAREASDLCALSWTHGLTFGDRACLATARRFRRTVLTADRGWSQLPDLGVGIRIIR